jgi:hypothetical protein
VDQLMEHELDSKAGWGSWQDFVGGVISGGIAGARLGFDAGEPFDGIGGVIGAAGGAFLGACYGGATGILTNGGPLSGTLNSL